MIASIRCLEEENKTLVQEIPRSNIVVSNNYEALEDLSEGSENGFTRVEKKKKRRSKKKTRKPKLQHTTLNNTHHATIRLVDLLRSFQLDLLVKSPTRVTATTKTVIDYIIANHPSVAVSVVNTAISDHYGQEAVISGIQLTREPKIKQTIRDIRPENIAHLNASLSKERWNFLNSSQHLGIGLWRMRLRLPVGLTSSSHPLLTGKVLGHLTLKYAPREGKAQQHQWCWRLLLRMSFT
ncbi:hypothetical protein J6590_037083 [Homalodisca vitripennis]|nr:hypothetical protein J6590_037083 [Homalodisca vitripennis]